MINFDFSPTNYERLVDAFLMAGYNFRQFKQTLNWEEKPLVFFRHDVDLDLAAALDLAKLEKKCGIKSTYCFTLSSPYYNLLGPIERLLVREISENGHDVALHCDATQYVGSFYGFLQDMEIFCSIFPFANKQIYSIHRPIKLSENLVIDHSVNLSSTIIWDHPVFYISDSTGQWLYGHPLQTTEFELHKDMQVLTHPIWWIRKGACPIEKIEDSLSENFKAKKEYLRIYLPKLFYMLYERENQNAD